MMSAPARRMPSAVSIMTRSWSIQPFRAAAYRIEPSDRNSLGRANSRLGSDLFVGEEIVLVESRFRLRVGPLDLAAYEALLPDRPGHRVLADLVRFADGGFLALSSRCTHLGCTVTFDAEHMTFPCPCHASAFDLRGDVLAAPAPRALDLHPVAIEGGVVRVDSRRRVERSRFEPGQVTSL